MLHKSGRIDIFPDNYKYIGKVAMVWKVNLALTLSMEQLRLANEMLLNLAFYSKKPKPRDSWSTTLKFRLPMLVTKLECLSQRQNPSYAKA